jgi:Tfp pilus assembly protein PilF
VVVYVILLIVATLLAYSPLVGCDFVNYDDPVYVSENPHVQAGITKEGMRWAWTTSVAGNWHPLTWMSLMLDQQLLGPGPLGFHLTNLLLHLANTLLLFRLFVRLTGAAARSFFVAALFALHPLHVESVAWVSERKDVLSTLFALLALLAYVRYAAAPTHGRFLLTALAFLLSLLAKSMYVTLPCLLLVLDFWPLERWRSAPDRVARSWRQLVLEKVPLLALSAAISAATVWAQSREGAVMPTHVLPFGTRLANALVVYIQYLRQMLLPLDLAVFYRYGGPGSLGLGTVLVAAALLAAVTALTVSQRRRRPYLLVGWLWYLGMLVPVIGLVQVGSQARADRYTYFPLVGIFLMLVWVLADFAARRRLEKATACLGGVVLGLCLLLSCAQVFVWNDSVTLWRHALEASEESALAHTSLGMVLDQQGQKEEALAHLQRAVALNPLSAEGHYFLGVALQNRGRTDEAIQAFQQAVRLRPNHVMAHNNLGVHFLRQDQLKAAAVHLQRALELEPAAVETNYNLGLLAEKQRDWRRAAECFGRAAERDPKNPEYAQRQQQALRKLQGAAAQE